MKSHLQSPKNVAPSLPWHLEIPSSFVRSSQWKFALLLVLQSCRDFYCGCTRNNGSHQLPLISSIATPKFIYQPYHKVLFRQKKQADDQHFHPNFLKQSNKKSSPQLKHHTHIQIPVQKIASLTNKPLKKLQTPLQQHTTHTPHG